MVLNNSVYYWPINAGASIARSGIVDWGAFTEKGEHGKTNLPQIFIKSDSGGSFYISGLYSEISDAQGGGSFYLIGCFII